MRLCRIIFVSLLLSGCMSPYGPTYLPAIRGLRWNLIEYNEAIIQVDETAPLKGVCRRDGLLLTAAAIALQNNFTHFDFEKNPNFAKDNLRHIANLEARNIPVFLCRGVCPTMYSADSISHLLAHRFTFSDSAETEETRPKKCL